MWLTMICYPNRLNTKENMSSVYSNLISYIYIACTERFSVWANTSSKLKSFICCDPKKKPSYDESNMY
jgi:hypothetical protein